MPPKGADEVSRVSNQACWLGNPRRGCGTAPTPIFQKPRAQWPGRNRRKPLRFCAPEIFAPPRGSPRKWGPGKGDYEHEVPIWSRPRWRFAYFAAMGKVGRRPQAAKSPAYNGRSPNPAPSSVTASPCHLPYPLCRFATSPLDKGSRPPRGRLFWGEPPSSAPFGAPSPRGEGFWGKA